MREQAQLGKGIEHHALRLVVLDGFEQFARGLRKLDFGRVVHRQQLVTGELAVVGDDLENLDAVDGPAVRPGAGSQLLGRLRQRDVQAAFAVARSFEQVLERQRGLAGAGIAVDQIEPAREKTAVQYLVESGNSGRGTAGNVGHRILPRSGKRVVREIGVSNRRARASACGRKP